MKRSFVIRASLLMSIAAISVVGGAGMAPQATAQEPTGLRGTVLRGPVSPVCRVGRPCYVPFRGTLVFAPLNAAQSSLEPVRTQTQLDGDYRATLEPARYRVTTARRSRFGSLVKPGTVTVPQSGMRHVDFVVDTGIR
jgi:hypothetical protein